MAVQPTYPGVYVQEVPSGVRTIAGVATSITAFIGRTEKGPLDTPIRCANYRTFRDAFGESSVASDLPRYVKLFYDNGGSDCYVLRIASGATYASVRLQSEVGGNPQVLELTAKSPGAAGEDVRAEVTYAGPDPESTFNLRLFRWVKQASGTTLAENDELFSNLTMDPASPRYAPDFITQNSDLVSAAAGAGVTGATNGYSRSGRPVAYDSTGLNVVGNVDLRRDAWEALLGTTASSNRFGISVDGGAQATVDLAAVDVGAITAGDVGTDLPAVIAQAINLQTGFTVTVDLVAGPSPLGLGGSDSTDLLRISSAAGGDVRIVPASTADLAVPLMLGSAQGGIEVGAHAHDRPAPTGATLRAADQVTWIAIASLRQDAVAFASVDAFNAAGAASVEQHAIDLETTAAAEPMWRDASAVTANGNCDGMREKLAMLRDAINDLNATVAATCPWRAELWGSRLALRATRGTDNQVASNLSFEAADGTTDVVALTQAFVANARYVSVGPDGVDALGNPVGLQDPDAAPASDGGPPALSAYEDAFEVLDREVDLFNLMVIPPDHGAGAAAPRDVWGPASVFCEARRAFLLMDSPSAWTTAQAASNGVGALRVGLVKDHAALYYPRLRISEDGREHYVGASGAIAGLMARTDGARGVWKAPAGIEADLRGIVGVERRFSDAENGILNPRAVNTIRYFSSGIVSWGARTMDGDDDLGSEYKYVPVRRLALYMEESLYRGLRWAVFEPNDEPLWAQIRLNVGVFVHNLFRQGAFQGATPQQAYFVRCDAETTTQADIDRGIVNIWVGFAPLKPAEFVVLYLQQKTSLTTQ